MSSYSYSTIVKKAESIKNNVKKNYNLGESSKWGYYIANAILNPKKDIKKISFDTAEKPSGTAISRQIPQEDYLDICKRLINYVEVNKQLPNYIRYKNLKIRVRVYVWMLAKILIYYDENKKLLEDVDVNNKVFTKPHETKNTVFMRWVTKFKFTPKYLDDVCDYILKHFTYQFYYDDHKSNEEVINSKSGNCTDLLQMLINMAEALGYEWKVIHTQCKQSGTGHVYGMFRKAGVNGGNWFVRDIACIADESRYCVWCEVPNGGYKLAENPNWFLQNLRR